MVLLNDNLFDNELNLLNNSQNVNIVLGISYKCGVCTNLKNELNKNNIIYGEVDIANSKLLKIVSKKAQTNQLSLPIILLYKSNKYQTMLKANTDVKGIKAALVLL